MIFETVAQLKLATLTAGQLVSTKGYYASGDGGAADYIVAATQAVDGYGDHALAGGTVALLQSGGSVDVKQYGAKGDGVTDDSAAIQAAIDKAALTGESVVGDSHLGFLINSGLTLKKFVTLGSTSGALATGEHYGSQQLDHSGFTLLVTDLVNPAITAQSNSTMKGVRFFYPNQTKTSPPVTYPASVKIAASVGNDVSVVNCAFPNSYYAIDATGPHERLRVQNIAGQPLYRGIVIDANTDCDHITGVHFWRYWEASAASPINDYINQNCIGLDIGRSDSIMVQDVFLYGMRQGIKCSDLSGAGAPYGTFSNISFDKCKWGLSVYKTNLNGIVFVGGLIAVDNPSETGCIGVVIHEAATVARVTISDYQIWGGSNASNIFFLKGVGTKVNISDNSIRTWGTSSPMLVIGEECAVTFKGNHVSAAGATQYHVSVTGYTGTDYPIIEGNRFDGPFKVAGTSQIYGLENNYEKAQDISITSAAATTIPALGSFFAVTGTTGISSFLSGNLREGRSVDLLFTGVLTLTHSAGLVLDGSANFTTTAGDRLSLVYYSGGWRELSRSTA